MLTSEHLCNAVQLLERKTKTIPDTYVLGFMEACLFQLGVIDKVDLSEYVIRIKKKFLFWEWEEMEGRKEVVTRLSKEYLLKNKVS